MLESSQWYNGVIHFDYPFFHIEVTLVQGKLLAVVPRLSAEWSLTYSINVKSIQMTDDICSFVILSTIEDHTIYGSRSPFHYIQRKIQDTFEMKFSSAINSALEVVTMSEMPKVGEWEHYEFHQRYVNGGKYRFFVKRNGEEVYSIINADARQFYDIKVWAGMPIYPACSADIKNLELTNFL